MRLIIAGGRDFQDYELLREETDKFIAQHAQPDQPITIISGLAKGADTLALQYASEKEYTVEGFTAEWAVYGRSAGIRRNKLMAKNADHLLAFWDGKSKGTMHMINYAHERGLTVDVIHYEAQGPSEEVVWQAHRRGEI